MWFCKPQGDGVEGETEGERWSGGTHTPNIGGPKKFVPVHTFLVYKHIFTNARDENFIFGPNIKLNSF